MKLSELRSLIREEIENTMYGKPVPLNAVYPKMIVGIRLIDDEPISYGKVESVIRRTINFTDGRTFNMDEIEEITAMPEELARRKNLPIYNK